MKHKSIIEEFVDNPSELVDVFREVINRLMPNYDVIATSEAGAQLSEVSKAIERLESAGVSVPDALRAEKTRLAASHGIQTESIRLTNILISDVTAIIDEHLARLTMENKNVSVAGKRNTYPLTQASTPKDEYYPMIIEILKQSGGSGTSEYVINEIFESYSDKFLPGDMEVRSAGRVTWRTRIKNAAGILRKKGVLKPSVQAGVWELSEEYL